MRRCIDCQVRRVTCVDQCSQSLVMTKRYMTMYKIQEGEQMGVNKGGI